MKQIRAILKREFTSYFKSPIGWILVAIFFFVSSLFFSLNFISSYSDIASELTFVQSLFFVLIPIITMKSFAEERKSGTEVLLFTSPASTLEIVLGKYLGAFCLFLLMSSTILLHVIFTAAFGGVINAVTWGTYLAFILSGAAYIAIGIYISSLTENQIIAAIVSVLIFIGFTLLSSIASLIGSLVTNLLQYLDVLKLISSTADTAAGTAVTNAINWINPATRLSDFNKGIFGVTPIIFLLSYIVLFLFLTVQYHDKRRWAQR
ncbi:ABC transporter permease subunit [Oscillospiraceae bacterium HV4-5-C5C]|nr:ABC transporter permease subunit [Oscillospiraceae bacterium HV4-5-C5C]